MLFVCMYAIVAGGRSTEVAGEFFCAACMLICWWLCCFDQVLIFCETKRGCDEVTRNLRSDGWPALALHGDKSQKERDWVLAEFKSGRHPLMLATDVAARGLGRHGSLH